MTRRSALWSWWRRLVILAITSIVLCLIFVKKVTSKPRLKERPVNNNAASRRQSRHDKELAILKLHLMHSSLRHLSLSFRRKDHPAESELGCGIDEHGARLDCWLEDAAEFLFGPFEGYAPDLESPSF